ncbi:MAG: ChaB family protein [Methanobacterium sp.]|nr:ChaB family protein [Methanobacterium sp.]
MADAMGGFFGTFIKYLYSTGDISIPSEYHDRCTKIRDMLDNDISGTINTVLDYAINSSSEAKYRIECSQSTLQNLLNLWLGDININIKGIPTGLSALSKEYFKERWEGSSFCILKVEDWEKITVDNVTIEVPTTLYFVNGSSIYVVRKNSKNYKLGSDKYYLDSEHKTELITDDEKQIIIQKPYNRWFDEYSTPYLIRKGVLKNWLGMKTLQDKSDEVISKILPYLFLITKGTPELFKEGVDYSDEELTNLTENFKSEVEKYKNQKGKTPTNAIPFDTKYEHLIPDISKVLKEELYRQGYRSILAGLGFIDMLEISPSRQETRMNPKAFISEINDGVSGFKSMLLEVIGLIELRNKKSHEKLFSDKGKLIIVNSPLRINVEQILDALRSGYDRGVASIESYQEILGLDPTTEKERRIKELENGDEDTFFPHVINNVEKDVAPDKVSPAKPRKEKNENQDKLKNTPEGNTKTAELEENCTFAPCKKCGALVGWIYLPESGMGYLNCPFCKEPNTQKDNEEMSKKLKKATTEKNLEIAPYDKSNPPEFLKKYPEGAREAFISTFNDVYEKTDGDESKAFPIAWNSLKRWMKKNGYHKEGKEWVKSEETK